MLWIVWFAVVFSYYGMFLWLPSVMVGKGFSLISSFEYVLIMTLAQLLAILQQLGLLKEREENLYLLHIYSELQLVHLCLVMQIPLK